MYKRFRFYSAVMIVKIIVNPFFHSCPIVQPSKPFVFLPVFTGNSLTLEASERRSLVLVSCSLKAAIQQPGISILMRHLYQSKVSNANRVALDKAHLLPRTCQHEHIRLPLAALSLDEDHQHARVLSRIHKGKTGKKTKGLLGWTIGQL